MILQSYDLHDVNLLEFGLLIRVRLRQSKLFRAVSEDDALGWQNNSCGLYPTTRQSHPGMGPTITKPKQALLDKLRF